jgi:hypothetical protein
MHQQNIQKTLRMHTSRNKKKKKKPYHGDQQPAAVGPAAHKPPQKTDYKRGSLKVTPPKRKRKQCTTICFVICDTNFFNHVKICFVLIEQLFCSVITRLRPMYNSKITFANIRCFDFFYTYI